MCAGKQARDFNTTTIDHSRTIGYPRIYLGKDIIIATPHFVFSMVNSQFLKIHSIHPYLLATRRL